MSARYKTRYLVAWAVMAMCPEWSKPQFVTGPCQQWLIFRTRRKANEQRKNMLEDKELIWRPWSDVDNPKADRLVEWIVRKVEVETMEVVK